VGGECLLQVVGPALQDLLVTLFRELMILTSAIRIGNPLAGEHRLLEHDGGLTGRQPRVV